MGIQDDVLAESKDRMAKAVSHLQGEFGSIRTGRASPVFVEKLRVDYYGSEVPLQQLAGFSVPEPRLLVISPYDKNAIKAIEKAIQASDLGITPNNLKVRRHRARRALRARLEETCRICAAHGCLDCTCEKKLRSKV